MKKKNLKYNLRQQKLKGSFKTWLAVKTKEKQEQLICKKKAMSAGKKRKGLRNSVHMQKQNALLLACSVSYISSPPMF